MVTAILAVLVGRELGLCVKCSSLELSLSVPEEQCIPLWNVFSKHFISAGSSSASISPSGGCSKEDSALLDHWNSGCNSLRLQLFGYGQSLALNTHWWYPALSTDDTPGFFSGKRWTAKFEQLPEMHMPSLFYVHGFLILHTCVFIQIRWILSFCCYCSWSSFIYFKHWCLSCFFLQMAHILFKRGLCGMWLWLRSLFLLVSKCWKYFVHLAFFLLS